MTTFAYQANPSSLATSGQTMRWGCFFVVGFDSTTIPARVVIVACGGGSLRVGKS